MVKSEELQHWLDELCKELGLPACDTIIYTEMDDYVGIIGEPDGGCLVVYEVANPEKYCVAVEKCVLQNRDFVYKTLKKQIGLYKEFIEHKKEER